VPPFRRSLSFGSEGSGNFPRSELKRNIEATNRKIGQFYRAKTYTIQHLACFLTKLCKQDRNEYFAIEPFLPGYVLIAHNSIFTPSCTRVCNRPVLVSRKPAPTKYKRYNVIKQYIRMRQINLRFSKDIGPKMQDHAENL
jgi:hypothetical protein